MGSWEDGRDGAGTRVVAVRGGQTGDLEGNKEGSIGGGRVQVQSPSQHLRSDVHSQADGGALADMGALQEEQVCGVQSPVSCTLSLRCP